MQELTQESINKTCQWFHDNCLAQIADIENSKLTPEVFYCNEPDLVILRLKAEAEKWAKGDFKMTFTFWQRAYQYQTGECIAFLG